MSNRSFSRLSSDHKGIILSCAREATEYGWQLSRNSEAESIVKLQKSGMRVLEHVNWQEFRSAVVNETRRNFEQRRGNEGRRFLEMIDRE